MKALIIAGPNGAGNGHHIPEAVIRRRYQAGLDNFARYAEQVNNWSLFDNDDNAPIEIMSGGQHENQTT